MSKPFPARPLQASDLPEVIEAARSARGGLVPVVMVSSAHCPWCDLILKEQLIPRLRSGETPSMALLVFDLADSKVIQLPKRSTGQPDQQLAPRDWAAQHRYKLAPTLVAINDRAEPVGQPLVGYASRDFYGAYLDDLIRSAQPHWKGNNR